MDPDHLRDLGALRNLREATAAQLANRLIAADATLPELRELQERLKLLDATLTDHGARDARRWSALLWPLGLVAGVLLLAASVPVPSVPVSLELRASSITLELPVATLVGPQPINGELRVEGFTSFESADAALREAATRERAERLSVRATQTWLRGLSLPPGTRLTLQARAEAATLLLESSRSPVTADVEVRGATALRLGDADAPLQRVFDHSEWLRLVGGSAARAEQAAPPMTLSVPLGSAAPLRLDNLHPSSLRFAERRESVGAGAVSSVASSLEGGTLNLPASAQTVTVNGGDWLELDGLVVERFELSVGLPLLLKLSGSARTLRMRVGEFERSLKPSWLEYVSHHHLVTVLWAAMAALWGALAWLRKHFDGAHT